MTCSTKCEQPRSSKALVAARRALASDGEPGDLCRDVEAAFLALDRENRRTISEAWLAELSSSSANVAALPPAASMYHSIVARATLPSAPGVTLTSDGECPHSLTVDAIATCVSCSRSSLKPSLPNASSSSATVRPSSGTPTKPSVAPLPRNVASGVTGGDYAFVRLPGRASRAAPVHAVECARSQHIDDSRAQSS